MSGRHPGIFAESFGCGPDLVMVHGWAMHSGIWRNFAESLADRVRVTLLDLPGHGRSGFDRDFSLAGVAARLADAAPKEAHWLGWSLGVLVMLAIAQSRPGAVRSVILVAGSPRFVSGAGWAGVAAEDLGQFANDFEGNYWATVKRFIALQTLGMQNGRVAAKQVEASLRECAPPDAGALRGGLSLLQQTDLRRSLAGLDCPSLALLGARDRLVPAEVVPAIEELAPRMEMHCFADAGHLPFLTHADRAASLIADFIARQERDTTCRAFGRLAPDDEIGLVCRMNPLGMILP